MIIQAVGVWIILFSESSYVGLISGMSLLGMEQRLYILLYLQQLAMLHIRNGELHH
jgi:hypothetical protein